MKIKVLFSNYLYANCVLQASPKSKGKGGRDPFVWYSPEKSRKGMKSMSMMPMTPYFYKGKYHKGKSSKSMKSSKKSMKSSKKKSYSKKGKYWYPAVTHKGAGNSGSKGKGTQYKPKTPATKGKGGTSYLKTNGTFVATKGKGTSRKSAKSSKPATAARAGTSAFNYNNPPKQELPRSYLFYGGSGKGNRGIDVFVYGRPNV